MAWPVPPTGRQRRPVPSSGRFRPGQAEAAAPPLAAHPDVAECAVIGVADALKGQ
ncbi:AMP-binding enzyme, partial [Streptomyces chartreusis]